MAKKRKKRSLWPLIIALVILLIAVAAVIVFKQYEYSVSADFYDGLRGGIAP